MRKISYILIVFLICSIFSCKKKVETIYFPIPDTLKQSFRFEKNSFWIYRNDSTFITDCTYVYADPASGTITYEGINRPVYLIDYISIPLHSGLFEELRILGRCGLDNINSSGYPLIASLAYYWNFCSDDFTVFVLHDDTSTNHHGENSISCVTSDPKHTTSGGDDYTEFGQYTGLTINNKSFENVRITESYSSWNSSYFIGNEHRFRTNIFTFYVSPGTGIVKMILDTDTSTSEYSEKRATFSWSLLRYNVIQRK